MAKKGDICGQLADLAAKNEGSYETVPKSEKLTEKQKEFCNVYMTNFNATQAYMKVYGCTYKTANTAGPRMLTKAKILNEIRALKELKNSALGNLSGGDVVELHMRIAFANMMDFLEFNGEAVLNENDMKEAAAGKSAAFSKSVGGVRLKDSSAVDGQLISEFSVGRGGAKVKLVDRQKSLRFLEQYFELNPSDRRKKEYDDLRGSLEGDFSVNISVGGSEL